MWRPKPRSYNRPVVKRLLAPLVSLALLAGCVRHADEASTALERIKRSGVMRVGFEGAYPPFNFLNEQKQFDGFDVDIANEIARQLGVRAEFVATQFEALIGGLDADKWDIVIAQMSITDKRRQQVDFTDPYVVTGGVIIVRQDESGYTTLADLKGKRVGAGSGTTFEDVATQAGAQVTTYKSVNQYVQDLQNKRLDAIINDRMTMGYLIKSKNLPVKISSTGLVSRDVIGMAIKKNNADFVAAVNTGLNAMKRAGTYTAIYLKWFGIEPAAF
jgi:L-cystine transport system substrate-binding protein